MRLGLLLPNQGVVFGATTVPELLEMADVAEGSGAFDVLWVGDNLLPKPRLESVTPRSALAGGARRGWLGTACVPSFQPRCPVLPAADFGTSGIPEVREEPRACGETGKALAPWGSLETASAGDRVGPAAAS
jgi:hypothetical protein